MSTLLLSFSLPLSLFSTLCLFVLHLSLSVLARSSSTPARRLFPRAVFIRSRLLICLLIACLIELSFSFCLLLKHGIWLSFFRFFFIGLTLPFLVCAAAIRSAVNFSVCVLWFEVESAACPPAGAPPPDSSARVRLGPRKFSGHGIRRSDSLT